MYSCDYFVLFNYRCGGRKKDKFSRKAPPGGLGYLLTVKRDLPQGKHHSLAITAANCSRGEACKTFLDRKLLLSITFE
jgi:hypothetical protein